MTAYWAEATGAFDADTYVAGMDGGHSIPLSDDLCLWLHSDTYTRTAIGQARSAAKIVRNSVGIQTSAAGGGSFDLSQDVMAYYCGGGGLGSSTPLSFFPERAHNGCPTWNWPGTGTMVDGKLILLMARMEPSSGAFGFSNAGWDAIYVDNPLDAPSSWAMEWLRTPSDLTLTYPFSMRDGGDGWIYAQVLGNDIVGDRRLFSIRWDKSLVLTGDMMSPQSWRGAKLGWTWDVSYLTRAQIALVTDTTTEGSVSATSDRFIFVDTPSFGGLNYLAFARASTDTGPFPSARRFYRPYGDDPNLTLASSNYLVYGGQGHPEQTWDGKGDDDLLCTYATNATGGHSVSTDESIYYIRPVKGLNLVRHETQFPTFLSVTEQFTRATFAPYRTTARIVGGDGG